MHNTCVSSSFSLRSTGPLSFSFNDYNCCSNDRFDRNPLSCSSCLSSQCCACCANLIYNRLPITSPRCLYGLRQSTLIQWTPYKRFILNGFERIYNSRFSVCDGYRSCYCENCNFQERKVCGRRGKLGKGRYRCLVFEEESERDSLSGGSGGIDQAEVMLSLLSEKFTDECFSVRERRGRSSRKIDVEKGVSDGGCNNIRSRKKNVESGILESRSQFEYKSKIVGSKEEDMRRKEDNMKVQERKFFLGRDTWRAKAKEEKDSWLKENSSGRLSKEERQNLLRESQKERVSEEKREILSRQEDHRRKVSKDGSSCSSYYSMLSGEYESDVEIPVKEERFRGESSSASRRNSERIEGRVSDEVREEFERHGDDSKEYGVVLRKEKAEISGTPASVVSDWRKKSEKKLTDVSVKETESTNESSKNQSRHRVDKESGYGNAFGSSSEFDDRNKRSNLSVNFDERTREQHKETSETETRMKYKQFKKASETYGTDLETSSSAQKLYSSRDENSSKFTTSVQEAREHHTTAGQINREEGDRGRSHKLAKASVVREMDIRGTSSAVRQSEIRTKNQEDYSARILSSVHDTKKQHQASNRVVDSRVNQEQLTDVVHSEHTSVSKTATESMITKQDLDLNFTYNSNLESREHHQLETNTEHVRTTGSRMKSQETTDVLTHRTDISISIVDDQNTGKSVIETAPTSSLLVARDSLRTESISGLAIEEITDENLRSVSTAIHKHAPHRSQTLQRETLHEAEGDEAHRQPLKFISPEDALASADRLQKSSAVYVGEFVQKVKNEISSSEIHNVKETLKTKLVSVEEQRNQSSLVSGVSQTKELDSKRSSRGSGTKGPSDEMWDVTEPSTQEPPEPEALENESASGNAVIKRSGRSLWNIIGDIVHFRWALRPESRGSASKSGGKSSPNQSTSSETWFSGHEPEESNDISAKRDRISLTQGSSSLDQLEEEKISSSRREVSSSSSSKVEKEHEETGVLQKDSSPKAIALPSTGATSLTKLTATFPERVEAESSPLLPSLQLGRSPVVEEILTPGVAGGSGSGSIVQSGDAVPTVLSNESGPEGNNEELKRRKLQRTDQVIKDRFDEWEEAYRFETEQRKLDEMFMREALLEAKKAAGSWEVPVGAVLVQAGKIIARGYNLVEQLRDSTAHAEMICIREASNVLRTWRLSETTLYVTLEPCPMCAGAILQARIDAVVWGAPNKLLGADGSWIRLFPNGAGGNELESSDKPAAPVHPFHPKIVTRRGILATECADTMQQFFQLRRKKEKKSEPSTPPSCLPISHHHPSKFFTKMHDAFHIMFCL